MLSVLLLAGIGVGYWILSREEPVPLDTFGPDSRPEPVDVQTPPQLAMVRPVDDLTERQGSLTTVIHPLVVELTQIQRGTFGDVDQMLPVGSGANARIRGTITGDRGAPQPGVVTFIAGPNEGRVLRTDSGGNFGASDLYQGLSIVRIESDRGASSEREVLLRQLAQTELNVPLGRAAASMVRGSVVDLQGEPIQGAEVRLDGSTAFSDDQGEFYFPRVSPGVRVLAVVKKHGYSNYRETPPIPRGSVIPRKNLKFVLHEGADLELTVEALVGSPGPSYAFVLPGVGQRVNSRLGQRTFPWHEVNPIVIHPGGTARIEGLQQGHVRLMVFHPGAVGSPPFSTLKLIPGRMNRHVFRLLAAPTLSGVVADLDGKPVRGARVVLESANRSIATTKVLQQKPTYNLGLVLPHLPSGLQEVETDARGRFSLSLFPQIDKSYYLTVVSRDGALRANRVLRAVPAELQITLEPALEATGALGIGLAGRFQALPVKVVTNGAPQDEYLLRAEEELLIEGLESGTWRVQVWWNREQLQRGKQLIIEDDQSARLDLVLPKGALEGQTAEERERAGR